MRAFYRHKDNSWNIPGTHQWIFWKLDQRAGQFPLWFCTDDNNTLCWITMGWRIQIIASSTLHQFQRRFRQRPIGSVIGMIYTGGTETNNYCHSNTWLTHVLNVLYRGISQRNANHSKSSVPLWISFRDYSPHYRCTHNALSQRNCGFLSIMAHNIILHDRLTAINLRLLREKVLSGLLYGSSIGAVTTTVTWKL